MSKVKEVDKNGTEIASNNHAKVKVLNFGSLNLDKCYSVDNFVCEGETIAAQKIQVFAGGKGLNQSLALALAGQEVWQAGGVGIDGELLLDTLNQAGVNTQLIEQRATLSGHAVIQVTPTGKNCIIIYAGANYGNKSDYIAKVLNYFSEGDWLILQNEIDALADIMRRAKQKGMKIALNPSPLNTTIFHLPLEQVDLLCVNEHEAKAIIEHYNLSESANDEDNRLITCHKNHKFFEERQLAEELLDALRQFFPRSMVLLTLGDRGSVCESSEGERAQCGIYQTKVVDTTGAGDTFTGYFLQAIIAEKSLIEALSIATVAAGIAVSRSGAAPSIPTREEVSKHIECYISE